MSGERAGLVVKIRLSPATVQELKRCLPPHLAPYPVAAWPADRFVGLDIERAPELPFGTAELVRGNGERERVSLWGLDFADPNAFGGAAVVRPEADPRERPRNRGNGAE